MSQSLLFLLGRMSLSQPVGLTASRNVEFLDIQSGALMPLYIKDMTTAALVTLLTELRGLTEHDAVRFVMRVGLDRAHEVIPLREPAAALRAPPTPRPVASGIDILSDDFLRKRNVEIDASRATGLSGFTLARPSLSNLRSKLRSRLRKLQDHANWIAESSSH